MEAAKGMCAACGCWALSSEWNAVMEGNVREVQMWQWKVESAMVRVARGWWCFFDAMVMGLVPYLDEGGEG